jgi:GTP cyclohydrolase II
VSDGRAVPRAIDALRRGWPVAIAAPGEPPLGVLAVETADAVGLRAFGAGAPLPLLLSGGRAETLKLTNQLDAADPDRPVLVEPAPWLDLALAFALADPQRDLATPLKGPFRTRPLDRPRAAAAALRLARLAGLLPALFVGAGDVMATVDADAVETQSDATDLALVVRARLPVEGAETAEVAAFRTPAGDEHVALLIGRPDGRAPLVRLHSECLTGDVFGSLKCDCGPQLHAAIAAIAAEGWGIVLYLRQEGRGIGLLNKLRAYQLQDQGFDTVDANTRLGFAVDARDYRVAARMLELLGQRRVRLLTNNPAKVAQLATAGIDVTERVAHALPPNPHNARYLATKRDRTGHQL